MSTHFHGHIRVKIISCAFMFLGGFGFIGGASAATCAPVSGGASATISANCYSRINHRTTCAIKH